MWPGAQARAAARAPRRGSASAERASTIWASPSLAVAATWVTSRTSPASRRAVKCRSRRIGRPSSSGRPSARHFGRPPSSTATSVLPKSRKVHQTRGALNMPSAVVDDDPVAVADAHRAHPARRTSRPAAPCAAGSTGRRRSRRCRRSGRRGCARPRTRRGRRGPAAGMCQLASRMRRSGALRCAASQSVETRSCGIAGAHRPSRGLRRAPRIAANAPWGKGRTGSRSPGGRGAGEGEPDQAASGRAPRRRGRAGRGRRSCCTAPARWSWPQSAARIAPRAKSMRSVATCFSTTRSPGPAKMISCSPTTSPPRRLAKPMAPSAPAPR